MVGLLILSGYIERFNGKHRDEKLNGELFFTLKEAQVLIENWRIEYNTFRPHSSLKYRPPAPESIQPLSAGWMDPMNMLNKNDASLTLQVVQ